MADTRIDLILRLKDRATAPAARALASLSRQAQTAARALAGLGAAGTAAGVALYAATTRAVDFADRLAKTADRAGVSTDALQVLRHAADLAGVDVDRLDTSLERFTRRLGEAQAGTGEAAAWLDRLGVELAGADGRARDVLDVLADVADGMERLGSAQERAAAASALFGREGAALTLLLRQGSEGLRAAGEEARRYGLILEERLLRRAEATKDTLTRLGRAIKTRLLSALLELAPALERAAEAMLDFLSQKTLPEWIVTLAGRLEYVARAFRDLGLGVVWTANLVRYGWEILKGNGDEYYATWKRRHEEILAQLREAVDLAGRLRGAFGEPPPPQGSTVRLSHTLVLPRAGADATQPAEDIYDEINRLAWLSAVRRAQIERDLADQQKGAWQRWGEAARAQTDSVARLGRAAMERFSDGVGQAFAQALVYGRSFRDAFLGLLRDMAAQAVAILSRIALGGVFSFFGLGNVGSVLSFGIFHEGGQVPRAHAGLNLAPDEVPIIAQTGERILSRRQNAELEEFLRSGRERSAPAVVELTLDGRSLGRALVDLARSGRLPVMVRA